MPLQARKVFRLVHVGAGEMPPVSPRSRRGRRGDRDPLSRRRARRAGRPARARRSGVVARRRRGGGREEAWRPPPFSAGQSPGARGRRRRPLARARRGGSMRVRDGFGSARPSSPCGGEAERPCRARREAQPQHLGPSLCPLQLVEDSGAKPSSPRRSSAGKRLQQSRWPAARARWTSHPRCRARSGPPSGRRGAGIQRPRHGRRCPAAHLGARRAAADDSARTSQSSSIRPGPAAAGRERAARAPGASSQHPQGTPAPRRIAGRRRSPPAAFRRRSERMPLAQAISISFRE